MYIVIQESGAVTEKIAVAGVGEQTATCGNYAGGIAGYLFGDLMFNIAEGFDALDSVRCANCHESATVVCARIRRRSRTGHEQWVL